MSAKQRRDLVFLCLSGIFIANALMAEMIGGKLFQAGPAVLSLGVIIWPVVFVTTDLINEYFGRDGVFRLTLFTSVLIAYAFAILYVGMAIPAWEHSPVKDEHFNVVFGQSLWIIVASLIAFIVSQGVDVAIFWMVRDRTGGGMLWLRSTGSTVVSQLIDTFVIMGIAFYLPSFLELLPPERRITFWQYVVLSSSNYTYKVSIAIAMTPVIYGGHGLIEKILGHSESDHLIEEAVQDSLKHS
jgi:uncharacterized integral membrane protein (TIGR00697 family)